MKAKHNVNNSTFVSGLTLTFSYITLIYFIIKLLWGCETHPLQLCKTSWYIERTLISILKRYCHIVYRRVKGKPKTAQVHAYYKVNTVIYLDTGTRRQQSPSITQWWGGVAQWVARLTRGYLSVVSSSHIKGPRCFLEQETLL